MSASFGSFPKNIFHQPPVLNQNSKNRGVEDPLKNATSKNEFPSREEVLRSNLFYKLNFTKHVQTK